MITKDTEKLIKTDIVQSLINKFNLKVKFIKWEFVEVPILYNEYVLIELYCERGGLELNISDIKNWRWNRIPIDSYDPENIKHKAYFEHITSNLKEDLYLNKDCNNYLHYYIHFIIDFMPEIFKGDLKKIEKHMEPMTKDQKAEIINLLQ